MTNRSEDEPAELSSPACSMSEADDTYTACKTEWSRDIQVLKGLLEPIAEYSESPF